MNKTIFGNIQLRIFTVLILVSLSFSCKKYLDLIPDNVATLGDAFSLRSSAERYLFTCYSYKPTNLGRTVLNSLFLSSGEVDLGSMYPGLHAQSDGTDILTGLQNSNNPLINYWDGIGSSGINLWNGIRDCNIFLGNIDQVPDMDDWEKDQWKSEVTFLKAYYYFVLLKMYGPLPLAKEIIPVKTPLSEMQLERAPVDQIFSYIFELIDSSFANLPIEVEGSDNLGRITLPIALAFKAKVSVYYASPLFNGNTDYATFTNKKGEPLISQNFEPARWDSAVAACKRAIDFCEANGYKLYEFESSLNLSDATIFKMNIRNSFAEAWNSEIIWADPNALSGILQRYSMVRFVNPSFLGGTYPLAYLSVPLNFADLFYTDKGLPIDEDKTWDYDNRYEIETVPEEYKFNLKPGYKTAKYYMARGNRFYADLSIDGGSLYGNGKTNDNDLWYYEMKHGQMGNDPTDMGLYPKKLVQYKTVVTSTSSASLEDYAFPLIRLTDLYLLYAEALNEAGAAADAIYNLNKIRIRAGVPKVEDAWDNYSFHPGRYNSKEGLREIIHRERQLELAFENQRFWDLRRWKVASLYLNGNVYGWDSEQDDPGLYYRRRVYREMKFEFKDYFWPIREYNRQVDPLLIQNPGW